MPKMPVMEAAVHIMESEGVDVTASASPVPPSCRSTRRCPSPATIKHLTVRHEEGATHAADGWARITGKVGRRHRHLGPRGHQHDHRPLHLHGRLHPDHLHHRPGVSRSFTRSPSRRSTSPRSPSRSPRRPSASRRPPRSRRSSARPSGSPARAGRARCSSTCRWTCSAARWSTTPRSTRPWRSSSRRPTPARSSGRWRCSSRPSGRS